MACSEEKDGDASMASVRIRAPAVAAASAGGMVASDREDDGVVPVPEWFAGEGEVPLASEVAGHGGQSLHPRSPARRSSGGEVGGG